MRNRALLPEHGDQSTLIKSISILRYRRAPSPFALLFGFKSVHRGKEGYLGNQRYEVKPTEREEGSYDTGCSPTFRVVRTPSPPTVKSSIRGKILTVPFETMLRAHNYLRAKHPDPPCSRQHQTLEKLILLFPLEKERDGRC